MAASWHKWLGTRLSLLESQICISVTPCGFHGGQNRAWVGFLRGFLPFSPTTNFIPPFFYTHLIHFVSFHSIRPCDGVTGMVSGILAIHRSSIKRDSIASQSSTRPFVGHELRIIIISLLLSSSSYQSKSNRPKLVNC